jgi:hypothetical protein
MILSPIYAVYKNQQEFQAAFCFLFLPSAQTGKTWKIEVVAKLQFCNSDLLNKYVS